MSEALVIEFAGVSTDDYDTVNGILGLDVATGSGDWPDGMISHVGAAGTDSHFVVFEVWDSQASQQAFMDSRLGPALSQAGVPEPTRMEWFTVAGRHNL